MPVEEDDNEEAEHVRGILTPKDEMWLNNEDDVHPSDQKRRLEKRLAASMGDIEKLVDGDFDVSNLDNIGELFDRTESDADLSRTETAKYLIALAFIITNDPLDYAEVAEEAVTHPREGSSPTDEDRATAGGPVNFDQPIQEILAFRNALSDGIKLGKQRYDDVPETVLIDSNTRLYKEPVDGRLTPDDGNSENWNDILAKHIDAGGVPGGGSTDLSDIEPGDAPRYLKHEIEFNIERSIGRRRKRSQQEVLQRGIDS
jgi:hypothetical protein